jgi:hypothetical protein
MMSDTERSARRSRILVLRLKQHVEMTLVTASAVVQNCATCVPSASGLTKFIVGAHRETLWQRAAVGTTSTERSLRAASVLIHLSRLVICQFVFIQRSRLCSSDTSHLCVDRRCAIAAPRSSSAPRKGLLNRQDRGTELFECGFGSGAGDVEPPDGTPGPYLDEVWRVAKLAFDGERVENRFNRALEKLEKLDLDAHEEIWQAAFDLVILWVDAAFTFGAAVGVTAAAAGRPFQAQQEMAS